MPDKIQFTVTDQHLKLIHKMEVRYDDECEFGAPAIDPKRPYGNSSVYHDIGEILGIEPETGDTYDPEFSDSQREEMLKLHKETAIVLKILLRSGCLDSGIYEADKYRGNWHKCDE